LFLRRCDRALSYVVRHIRVSPAGPLRRHNETRLLPQATQPASNRFDPFNTKFQMHLNSEGNEMNVSNNSVNDRYTALDRAASFIGDSESSHGTRASDRHEPVPTYFGQHKYGYFGYLGCCPPPGYHHRN
jgi:hypothetical protein